MNLLSNGALTSNKLKILALIFMTIDHIGVMLFPGVIILRMIGRLAFPIFAYFIGEGIKYTKNRTKYLITLLVFALFCQIVYYISDQSLYMSIFVTFSLSVLLAYTVDSAIKNKDVNSIFISIGVFFIVIFISEFLPNILSDTDFRIDYGIFGILLPLFVYLGKDKKQKILYFSVGLLLLLAYTKMSDWIVLSVKKTQVMSLLAIPIMMLYNGERGSKKLKYLFYVYYPLHLFVIYLIGTIIM